MEKRQKDLEEKTKDHQLKKQIIVSNDLPIIKEDNASDSRNDRSINTLKKGSRVGTYKIEEPECEDNPSMVRSSNNNLLSGNIIDLRDKTKGRYSQIIKPDENKLNKSSINVEIKDESQDLLQLNGSNRLNEQDNAKNNQDEESESCEIPSSRNSNKSDFKKLERTDKNDKKESNNGMATVKTSRTR